MSFGYKPTEDKLRGAASFDLPLNGMWSDYSAVFVLFETGDDRGFSLKLEEFSSITYNNIRFG